MSTDPNLGCLLYAMCASARLQTPYAVVTLDEERIEQILVRIEESKARGVKEADFLRLSFRDWGGVSFYRYSSRIEQMADEGHERHDLYCAIQELDKAPDQGRLILCSALGNDDEIAEDQLITEMPVMSVYETGSVSWQAENRYSYEVFKTASMTITDLLMARLFLSSGELWDARFAEMIRVDPECAIDVLERGFQVVGLGTIDVKSKLGPEALVPLLEHPDERHRQWAIAALGDLGKKATPRSRGTRR